VIFGQCGGNGSYDPWPVRSEDREDIGLFAFRQSQPSELMKGSHCNVHLPPFGQMLKLLSDYIQPELTPNRLEEENHGELGMDYRLFNVNDVQPFFKEKLGHF
jgi:hypothetical protein